MVDAGLSITVMGPVLLHDDTKKKSAPNRGSSERYCGIDKMAYPINFRVSLTV
jgi:hypothetical protein